MRKLIVVIAVVVLAGAAYRVLGVYRFRTGDCSAPPAAKAARTFPAGLRIMSFNVQGHAALLRQDHIEEVAETIRRYRPDVVAVNEAHRHTWQARFHDHVNELRARTGMHSVFGRSYRFAGGEFGNAVLTRGTVVSSRAIPLPGVGEPRSLLESVIRINGGTIAFYVTHTSAWGSIGRAARTQQLQCIADHVRASPHPVLLAGDLNAPAGAPEVVAFMASAGLRLAGDPAAATHRVTGQRLDYILAGPGWTVTRADVLDDGPSDHRPVVAELNH